MHYIEAPLFYKNPTIFLAGGITDCPNWQNEITTLLVEKNRSFNTTLTIFNPRRKSFSIDDSNIAETQIQWEYEHLRKAEYILFWFPSETLCPIVLYELGFWITSNKKIFIGIDPAYSRKQDVEIQTRLIRPAMYFDYSLPDLATTTVRGINCLNF